MQLSSSHAEPVNTVEQEQGKFLQSRTSLFQALFLSERNHNNGEVVKYSTQYWPLEQESEARGEAGTDGQTRAR